MNMAWDYSGFKHPEVLKKFASVTASDPEFYQLDQYHDEKQVLSHIAKPLKENRDLKMDRVEIVNVWHVFGKRFQVVYQLGNRESSRNKVLLSIRFFSPEAYDSCSQKIRAEAHNPDDLIDLPEWRAIANLFPEDAALPSLRRMIDQKTISHHLKSVTYPSNPEKKTEWKLLGYRPGERAAIKYRLPQFPLVGKTSKHNLAIEAHQQMTTLWLSPGRSFQMPQPIALDPAEGIRWETFLPGERVEVVFSEINFSHFIKMVCTSLTKLHHSQIKNPPPRRHGDCPEENEKENDPQNVPIIGTPF